MIIDEKKRNAESNVLVDDTRYHIEINKVPIYWDSKKGNLTFFGIVSINQHYGITCIQITIGNILLHLL